MLLCGGVGDDSFVGGDVSVEVEVVVATVSRKRWFLVVDVEVSGFRLLVMAWLKGVADDLGALVVVQIKSRPQVVVGVSHP